MAYEWTYNILNASGDDGPHSPRVQLFEATSRSNETKASSPEIPELLTSIRFEHYRLFAFIKYLTLIIVRMHAIDQLTGESQDLQYW
ncbi:hypothetical protein KEM54_005053 [Ascosphaera aggregata]|nr:hypothetical protein KEM54_005053 [Ascosphaera aggregata]